MKWKWVKKSQLKVQELQISNKKVHELTINYLIVHEFELHTNGSKKYQ